MPTWWTTLSNRLSNALVADEEQAERKDMVEAVDRARRDWMAARAYFDNVTDPDLIDHAIYSVQAAERKYVYLLRCAEETGYRVHEDDLRRLTHGPAL